MENSLQRHNKNDNRALNGAHENLLNYKNKGIIILKGKNKRVKKMRKTNNTMTEIRAIDYSKKVAGTGRYYSFCPNCGWRGDCDDLLFDVSEVIISYVTEAAKGTLSEENQKIFKSQVEKIKILKSTKQLRSFHIGIQVLVDQLQSGVRVQIDVGGAPLVGQSGEGDLIHTHADGLLPQPGQVPKGQVRVHILLEDLGELPHLVHVGERQRLLSHGF